MSLGLLTGSWPSRSVSPNEGVQATASSLRFAVLRCGFQPRVTPSVRCQVYEEHSSYEVSLYLWQLQVL